MNKNKFLLQETHSKTETALQQSNDLSENQMQQLREDLQSITPLADAVCARVSVTVKSLHKAADFMDEVSTTHNLAHVTGSSLALIGTLFAISGAFATLATAGLASPFMFTGIAFGVVGAGTNVVAKIIEWL